MYEMSEREAFEAMTLFLNQYAQRAGDDLVTLLSDIKWYRSSTSDPAAWEDWMRCVVQVIGDRAG